MDMSAVIGAFCAHCLGVNVVSIVSWILGAQVEAGARLSIQREKNQVLFSGTKVLQHSGDRGARIRTPDGGCLAVVLRTGFETSQGPLPAFFIFHTSLVVFIFISSCGHLQFVSKILICAACAAAALHPSRGTCLSLSLIMSTPRKADVPLARP
jgi:magnesium-transporting ATPase (P-type)